MLNKSNESVDSDSNTNALYIVNRAPNTRARKLAGLSEHFSHISHFESESMQSDIKPLPNWTGFLRYLRLERLKRWLDRQIYFPSRNILFVVPARKKILKMASKDLAAGKRVTVFVAVPPHDFTELVVYLKNREPNIRVVLDWQDLWSYDETYLSSLPQRMHHKLRVLEAHAFRLADLNITSNEYAKQVVCERYGVPESKVMAINHHFDRYRYDIEPDYSGLNYVKGAINIAFLGNLFKGRKVPGEKVLEAVDRAAEHHPVHLHVIGDDSDEMLKCVSQLKNNCVTRYPGLPLEFASKKLAACDALLIVLGDLDNSKLVMHGKLPDYLSLQKPILAMVPEDSFVANVIRECSAGFILGAPEGVDSTLDAWMYDWLTGARKPLYNESAIAAYHWPNIEPRWLAAILSEDAQCRRGNTTS